MATPHPEQSRPDLASFDIPGAPRSELNRSEASARVARLAARSGLAMVHYEHRHRLELPEHWQPLGRPDLQVGASPGWKGGMLAEPKYGAFRHDRLLGSFHPGHGPGWTTHELCHGLVGFAWRPDAPALFHVLAARLAEVLPVALWYFLDLAAGGEGREHEVNAAWLARGRAFVEHELAAVARSARTGVPEPHRLGSLDLSSDALAYAAAHGPRLDSPEFAWFVERFFDGPEHGLHRSLESLAARTEELLEHLLDGSLAQPLEGGVRRWRAQDVAWRLLTVRAETDGDAAHQLERIVDRLAGDLDIAAAIGAYRALAEDFVLAPEEALFATGYPLPGGLGLDGEQVAAGLSSACPRALGLLERAGEREARTQAFLAVDADPAGWSRTPLGRRFATHLRGAQAGAAADMAALEAALAHAPRPDPVAETLGAVAGRNDQVRLRPGVELLTLSHDVLEETLAALASPQHLAVWRTATGEVQLAELDAGVGAALEMLTDGGAVAASQLALRVDDLAGLRGAGLIIPAAWPAG